MKEFLKMGARGAALSVRLILSGLMGLKNFYWGEVNRNCLLYFYVPLALFAYTGGMLISVWLFPGPYDWRYQVMCSLASPVKNPAGYVYWSIGIALSNFLGLPTCGYLARRFSGSEPRISFFAGSALRVGYTAGILVGLEPVFFPNFGGVIYKAHEILTITTIAGLYFGLTGFWYCSTRWWRKVRRYPAWFGFGMFLLPATPISGALLSQAWLYFDPHRPGWVSREWIALGIPCWLSCAFWEWIAVSTMIFCLGILVLVLPARPTETCAHREVPS